MLFSINGRKLRPTQIKNEKEQNENPNTKYALNSNLQNATKKKKREREEKNKNKNLEIKAPIELQSRTATSANRSLSSLSKVLSLYIEMRLCGSSGGSSDSVPKRCRAGSMGGEFRRRYK